MAFSVESFATSTNKHRHNHTGTGTQTKTETKTERQTQTDTTLLVSNMYSEAAVIRIALLYFRSSFIPDKTFFSHYILFTILIFLFLHPSLFLCSSSCLPST